MAARVRLEPVRTRRSKRPLVSPRTTRSGEVVGKIIYLRQHYHFGPTKITMMDPSAVHDPTAFTDDEKWTGCLYELAVEIGDTSDKHLQLALSTLWRTVSQERSVKDVLRPGGVGLGSLRAALLRRAVLGPGPAPHLLRVHARICDATILGCSWEHHGAHAAHAAKRGNRFTHAGSVTSAHNPELALRRALHVDG